MYYSFPEENINEELNNNENQDRRESSDHHHHHHHTTGHYMEMPHMMKPMQPCPYMHMCHMMHYPMMEMPMGYGMKTDKSSCSDDDMTRQHPYQHPYQHHYYPYHPYHPYHPYYPFFPFYPHYPEYYHHGYTQRPHYMGREDMQEEE